VNDKKRAPDSTTPHVGSSTQPRRTPASDVYLTRRHVLGAAALGGSALLLGACSAGSNGGNSGQAGGTINFWDMEWGAGSYVSEGQKLTRQFSASNRDLQVSYQAIPWAGWYQKFVTAIASNSAPNCSSGSGYQAFQFTNQGAIEPTDSLVADLTKSGAAADFLPGTIDLMRYQGHYAAIPWAIDIRVLYYRKSLLEKAGVQPPTTWPELLDACKALKKQGIFGFNMEGNAQANGWQYVLSLMINNGGGWFDSEGHPDCVTDANLETLEFFQQLAKDKYIDPASIEYTSTDGENAFGSGQTAITIGNPGFNTYFSSAVVDDMGIMSPLTSPQGTKGTLYWVNNLMIYKSPGNYTSDNVWLEWYLDNMKAYWANNLVAALPVRKSFETIPAVKNSPFMTVALNEWVPVAKSTAAVGSHLFPQLDAVEASTAATNFVQQVIQGSSGPKQILQALQSGLEQLVPA
jgi:multiple sugar transport system substrate-binding protein